MLPTWISTTTLRTLRWCLTLSRLCAAASSDVLAKAQEEARREQDRLSLIAEAQAECRYRLVQVFAKRVGVTISPDEIQFIGLNSYTNQVARVVIDDVSFTVTCNREFGWGGSPVWIFDVIADGHRIKRPADLIEYGIC